jgi:transposase-like protein
MCERFWTLPAIHAQESREAADNKARAIVDDLRASKMAKAADLVEQAVQETLTYYGFPDIHWLKIRTNNPLERIMKEIRVEPASSVLSPTVSLASTWRLRDYGTSSAQHGRPNAT